MLTVIQCIYICIRLCDIKIFLKIKVVSFFTEHKNAVFNFHKSPRSHEVVIDEDSNRQLMPDLHSHVSKKRKAQTSPKTHVSSSADHDRTSLAVKTIQMPLQPVVSSIHVCTNNLSYILLYVCVAICIPC